jgi:hypothetical protein
MFLEDPKYSNSLVEKKKLPAIEDMFEPSDNTMPKGNEKVYTDKELDEKLPLTNTTLREILAKKEKFKEKKPEKTPEEREMKARKIERDRFVSRVYNFLNDIHHLEETFATFKNTGYSFADDVEEYESAKKDVLKGKFGKAKKLIFKEMKHVRIANETELGSDFSTELRHSYSAMENIGDTTKMKKKEYSKNKEGWEEKAGHFMDRMIRSLEKLADENDSSSKFDKKLKDYKEARKEMESGDYDAAKKLLLRELKHSRLVSAAVRDGDPLRTFTSIYETIEKLEQENLENRTVRKQLSSKKGAKILQENSTGEEAGMVR